jgi:hypothetical protein
MYPNPASDVVKIEVKNGVENFSFSIFNSFGRKISNIPFQKETNFIELSVQGLSSGIYFVTISNGKNKSTKKLIVK